MPRKFGTAVVTNARGEIALREKVARAKIVSRLANMPPCLIGIEAGMGNALCDPRSAHPRPRREASAAGLCQAFPADPQE